MAPAEIVVQDPCTLSDAIVAANTDSPSGGCPAGSGADTLTLTGDVALSEALPRIETPMTIEGNDFAVFADEQPPSFPILTVDMDDTLTLNNATLSNGVTGFLAPGYAAFGDFYLNNVTVSDNVEYGIFVRDYASTLTLTDSTVANNGVGLEVRYYSQGRAEGSTFVGNVEGVSGRFFDGVIVLTNSTVSGNDVGVSLYYVDNAGVLLENTTVAGNRVGASVIDPNYPGQLNIVNTVLGGNAESNCVGEPMDDLGGNLDDDGTCGAGFGLLTGLDPVLADNGGPTRTHALLEGSSAIDAGGDCGLEVDQRGVGRVDGACDSGSFEAEGGTSFQLSVSGTCPGEITIGVAASNPDQAVILFAGLDEGVSHVPSGSCGGTELGIAFSRRWRSLTTDGDGGGSVTLPLSARWCGRFLQALQRDCSVSNVAQVP